MKKILFINLYVEIGGGEAGLLNITKEIDRESFEPVLLINKYGPLYDAAIKEGIKVVIIPFGVMEIRKLLNPINLCKILRDSIKIYGFVKKENIDLIHCSDLLSVINLLFVKLFLRTPVIYHIIFFHEKIRLKALNILGKFIINRFVACSNAVKTDFLKKTNFPEKKVSMIWYGIDLQKFRKRDTEYTLGMKSKLNLPPGKHFIAMIARYDTWKGHSTFINAAEEILRKRDNVIFGIFGGNLNSDIHPMYSHYEKSIINQIKDRSLQDKILLFGHRDDIPEIISAIDIFVCPSQNEPFGLVLAEAMASYVPVIASDSGGPMEIIINSESGLVFPTGNSRILAQKIDFLIDNPDISEKIRKNAYDRVGRMFDYRRFAKDFSNIYSEILNMDVGVNKT